MDAKSIAEMIKEAAARPLPPGRFLPVYRGRQPDSLRLDLRPLGPCRDLEPLPGSSINRPPGEPAVPFDKPQHCGGSLSADLLGDFIQQSQLKEKAGLLLTAADHNNLACALIWLDDKWAPAREHLDKGLKLANDAEAKVIAANRKKIPAQPKKPPLEIKPFRDLRVPTLKEETIRQIEDTLWPQGATPGAVGKALDLE